jgi:hypothetical protein
VALVSWRAAIGGAWIRADARRRRVLFLAVCVVSLSASAQASRAATQLPNLVADPPGGVILETSTTEGGLTSGGEAKLLLRFNGYVHNKGPGALDFRGRREAPKVSSATVEQVERARAKEEDLPQKTEEELAVPPMQVFQRLFTTAPGVEETNIERAHLDETSSGEMVYVSADGHHHWHLQRIAQYSLWNATKTAQTAPAQKVGFCLEDSEHVESGIGPSSPVYEDNVAPYRDFCQRYNPDATSLFEGISPGWRDSYTRDLAYQWVDVSDVLPGEYWLREDVNPLGFVKETGGANAPAYATSRTIIPGFDALAQSVTVPVGEATTLTLTSKAWKDTASPTYAIVTQPQHGTVKATASSGQVVYTPAAGYTGPDSFTFSASDPHSAFPRHPAIATVSIEIAPASTTKTLLAGDATSTYGVSDQTVSGHEEAFQFTAKSSGTVEELQFRTNATSNSGLTSVGLGIFADNAGKPGEVLGRGTASGVPAPNSWLKASGLATAIVAGTKYWLVVLPIGESSKYLHYNVAAAVNAGTGNVESVAGGLTTLTAEPSWTAYNQGPLGFQALGTTSAQPSVTIEGAPERMTVNTSVQLSARVSNDSPAVTWKASAGSITSAGLYTAPAEPPSGGSAVITATTSKGAQATVSIEIAPASTTKTLLAGDATSTYGVSDQTVSGHEEAFQFTAKSSGTVEELQFRTNATSNSGLTSVGLGIFADNAGKPGEVLGRGTASGVPAPNSWLKASGLATAIVAGTKYWLVVLPIGESSKYLHYNVAAAVNAGTGNVESVAGGLTTLTAEPSWTAYNQGPLGFQALGTTSGAAAATAARANDTTSGTPSRAVSAPVLRPRVMIEGAPAAIVAGTSVQLSARVVRSPVSADWRASAGSTTSGGLYTAPTQPPRSGIVSLVASIPGARDARHIVVLPQPPALPAPAAPVPSVRDGVPAQATVTAPQAVRVPGVIVLTTVLGQAGRARLSLYEGHRRLGTCAVRTPGGRSFSCRLKFSRRMRDATLGAWASLRIGSRVITSGYSAARAQRVTLPAPLGLNGRLGPLGSAMRFTCGATLALVSPVFAG